MDTQVVNSTMSYMIDNEKYNKNIKINYKKNSTIGEIFKNKTKNKKTYNPSSNSIRTAPNNSNKILTSVNTPINNTSINKSSLNNKFSDYNETYDSRKNNTESSVKNNKAYYKEREYEESSNKLFNKENNPTENVKTLVITNNQNNSEFNNTDNKSSRKLNLEISIVSTTIVLARTSC